MQADLPPLWPGCGWQTLAHDANGGLAADAALLRLILARPELAPVPESCDSERALHAALLDDPLRPVTPERLARLHDPDARENHGFFLHLRARLLGAGTVQRFLLQQFRPGPVDVPPPLLDWLVQLIVRDGLEGEHGPVDDALQARAGELLFRPQRISLHDGRVLAADRDSLDQRQATAGLGELGRLLREAQMPLRGAEAAVLGVDNGASYWRSAALETFHSPLLLDLTHEITRDVGHGVKFTLRAAHSGQQALAQVLERWVAQLLGVAVRITPVARIDDPHWRWHIGLDAEASAILNDLYAGEAVEPERLRRLIGLFRLDFADAAEMRPDVAGYPVWLGLAMTADGALKLKPQNLLINLPLRAAS